MAPTKSTTTRRDTTKSAPRNTANVWTEEERAAVQASARERKVAAAPRSGRGTGRGRTRGPREDRRDADGRSRHGRADPRARHDGGAVPRARRRTTGCPRTPRTARSSASSSRPRSSRSDTRRSNSRPDAHLDDGEMWPVSFAVIELTPRSEARIAELVKKAAELRARRRWPSTTRRRCSRRRGRRRSRPPTATT